MTPVDIYMKGIKMDNIKKTAETVGAVAGAAIAVLYLGVAVKMIVDLTKSDKPKRVKKLKIVK